MKSSGPKFAANNSNVASLPVRIRSGHRPPPPLALLGESIHLACPHEDVWSAAVPVSEALTVPGESGFVDVSTRRVADMLICGGVDTRTRPQVEPSSCPHVDVRTPMGVSAP